MDNTVPYMSKKCMLNLGLGSLIEIVFFKISMVALKKVDKRIFRAKFSSITPPDIKLAMVN
jgi:hypothetical protein